MKSFLGVLGILVGFAAGWFCRPVLDPTHIAVIAESPAQGVNSPPEGTGFVLYKGIDDKMHWGYTRLPNTENLPKGDPATPKDQFH
jgi:hypothetical protein